MAPANEKAAGPARVVGKDIVYQGKRINLERLTVQAEGRRTVREVVRHPGAAVILPLTNDGQVIFVRSYRVSVGQELLELPAGTLEPGENPADCAARELAEETGYSAERIEPLAEFFSSPGVMDERMAAFVATGLSPGQPRPEAGELVRPCPVGFDQAVAMCLDGRIRDAKSIATLLLYQARQRRGDGR